MGAKIGAMFRWVEFTVSVENSSLFACTRAAEAGVVRWSVDVAQPSSHLKPTRNLPTAYFCFVALS